MQPLVLNVLILCISLLAIAGCSDKNGPQGTLAPPAPKVGIIQAQPQDLPLTKEQVGRLSPYRSADVRARVAGILLKRAYDEGTEVKKGQLLFQIDPLPFKAVLDANLAILAQTQATYTNNKINADRARKLIVKGFITQTDLNNAEAAERTAAAAVQQAQANVQTARINLSYTDVISPISGRADKQQVTEGALVGKGDQGVDESTLLTTVDQIDPLYVNFTMSIREMEQMRHAQRKGNVTLAKRNQTTVQLTLPDGSPYPELGVVDFSASIVHPETGSVDLRAVVPNPEYYLLPGTFVAIKAKLGRSHNVFLISQEAVQRDTGGTYVMIVSQDSKAIHRNVITQDMREGNWIITGGLKAGEQVIVSGLQRVREGMPVNAIPQELPDDE
ncbi:GntR family transcriptional regulator [Candidatus Nitrosoglobus terrae]|uniref:GntR family transcriptional regulator n=1 Tax=Candidatus Nitrosoglobus terrae TaxID=1630141 RepID=A0A1Q2SL45_9GAMM|nr:efflux RND transporter periplasmic adaptor subunit [Candidatus Nitrosoglobus terrae]BAW79833.1 GntR family transcriptional regulator [Candidatus Nitrosoglobus terrae]